MRKKGLSTKVSVLLPMDVVYYWCMDLAREIMPLYISKKYLKAGEYSLKENIPLKKVTIEHKISYWTDGISYELIRKGDKTDITITIFPSRIFFPFPKSDVIEELKNQVNSLRILEDGCAIGRVREKKEFK